ncbi:MAG: hypothetical protein MJK07_15735 [Flavobacteriales bacterium]|nr:hypothetical protein [Flavobacteriales bacterium]
MSFTQGQKSGDANSLQRKIDGAKSVPSTSEGVQHPDPAVQASREIASNSQVSPSPTTSTIDSPALGGVSSDTTSKKDFLQSVGANDSPAQSKEPITPKAEFLTQATDTATATPAPVQDSPSKKSFLESIGANKTPAGSATKAPEKKVFLDSIGASDPVASPDSAGPSKKEFVESLTTNPVQGETEEALVDEGSEVLVDTKGARSTTGSDGGGDVEGEAPEEAVLEEAEADKASSEEAGKEEAPAEGEEEGDGKKKKAAPKKSAGFLATVKNIKTTTEEQVEHDPVEQLADEAQAAAISPPSERVSGAQAAQVDEMDKQEPQVFDAATFKSMLMERIKEMQLPKNNEQADDFENNNNIKEVNTASKEDVQKEKNAAAGAIEGANAAEPNTEGVEERIADPLIPVNPGKKPKSAKANKAIPDKRPDSEVNQPIKEETAKVDDKMAENDVTDKQLEISQEPKFEKALSSKQEAKAEAEKAPEKLRQDEKGVLNESGEKAEGTSQEQLEGMNVLRGTAVQNVVGGQQETGEKDTSERGRIASEINTIYETTKKDVDVILETLDTDVNTKFEAATTRAKEGFENHVALKMARYKAKRYSGWRGAARWGWDLLAGLPDEVNEFFVTGRQVFVDVMDAEITVISEIVATKLNEAKQRIETGKQEVTDYVDELPANLKSLGKEAADDIQDKFDELTEDVNAQQDDLVDSLADQYSAALDEVDERIEEMKAANRGLIGMVMDFIDGVIETIRKLKEAINNLLSAIASVIGVILADPIGFMGQLFEGIGKGIDLFKANIEKHLIGGLLAWLTGSLGPMGITVPDDIFSLKGIFDLVMQVLGMGWDFMRAKAVRMMGEPMVNALESGFEMFKLFAKEGVAGIWEYLKDQFSDLKETVMGAIKSMLITKVIEGGIKWLLSLLIPGAGFIKAIMAIKDIIVFFVESAIMLIPAITKGILALAGGSIAAVGAALEEGLGRLIPLIIGLFARLIGLGGLTKRVMKIFKKIRKRIDKAVNKLLKKAKKAGRKLMRKKKGKKGDAKKIKEENKIGKPEELTAKDKSEHKKIADKIVTSLKEGPKKGDESSFKEYHTKKKKEAKSLEDKYQPKLKKGINLDIKFDAVSKDEKDGDVDFEVVIAPNATRKKGRSNHGRRMTPSMVKDWKSLSDEGKLIRNGEYEFENREAFGAYEAIQEKMHNHHKGTEGDRSVAYAAVVEQYIGGPGAAAVPFIGGTLHVNKAKNELKFFRNASEDKRLPDEVRNNLKGYADKLEQANEWIVQMKGRSINGDSVSLPSWARSYLGVMENLKKEHQENPEVAVEELSKRKDFNRGKKERKDINHQRKLDMQEQSRQRKLELERRKAQQKADREERKRQSEEAKRNN